MTKGQKAMALAFIYPEPAERGRGHKIKSSETVDFSRTRVKQARTVLHHNRALAESVLVGVTPLDTALRAMLATEILPLLEQEARVRMAAGGGDKKSGTQKVADPIPDKGQI